MRSIILFYLQLSFDLAEDKIENINLQNIPSNNLLSIVSDRSNFVWIGTDQSLVRYDRIDIDVFRSCEFLVFILRVNDSGVLLNVDIRDHIIFNRLGYFSL